MSFSKRFWSWCRRLFRLGLWAILALVLLLVVRCLYVFRDRSPGYRLDLAIRADASAKTPKPLRAGFARVNINPDLSDPRRPVWLAGFSQNRAATRIHDDLWATACVLDDGYTRVGIVALDAIGFFHDDVIRVRRGLGPELGLAYTVVCSAHNHSTPDLMGLWGPHPLKTGVDPVYRDKVIAACMQGLKEAVGALQPVRLSTHEIPTAPPGLVTDTRKPEVYDADLRVLHFTRPDDGQTVGTIVGWGNHPETPWSHNTEITSDYCGALRDQLADGVKVDGRLVQPGLGGIHLFANGAVGGLMTTSPNVTVHDPYLEKDFKEASHEKSLALGRQLVSRILPRLTATDAVRTPQAPISVYARTVEVPLDNAGFLLATVLGLLDRGHSSWMKMRTEVALIQVGEVSLACVPGEVYPEIVNGGIERAEGGDYDIAPVEVPSLRELMPGRVKFVLGLANDEIGYIIPKSEWDREPPYLYGAKRGVYGEVNSVGPETAPILHGALRDLCEKAKAR